MVKITSKQGTEWDLGEDLGEDTVRALLKKSGSVDDTILEAYIELLSDGPWPAEPRALTRLIDFLEAIEDDEALYLLASELRLSNVTPRGVIPGRGFDRALQKFEEQELSPRAYDVIGILRCLDPAIRNVSCFLSAQSDRSKYTIWFDFFTERGQESGWPVFDKTFSPYSFGSDQTLRLRKKYYEYRGIGRGMGKKIKQEVVRRMLAFHRDAGATVTLYLPDDYLDYPHLALYPMIQEPSPVPGRLVGKPTMEEVLISDEWLSEIPFNEIRTYDKFIQPHPSVKTGDSIIYDTMTGAAYNLDLDMLTRPDGVSIDLASIAPNSSLVDIYDSFLFMRQSSPTEDRLWVFDISSDDIPDPLSVPLPFASDYEYIGHYKYITASSTELLVLNMAAALFDQASKVPVVRMPKPPVEQYTRLLSALSQAQYGPGAIVSTVAVEE